MLSDSCEDDSIAAHAAYQQSSGKNPRRQYVTEADSSLRRDDKAQTVFPSWWHWPSSRTSQTWHPVMTGGAGDIPADCAKLVFWSWPPPSSQPISLVRVGPTEAAAIYNKTNNSELPSQATVQPPDNALFFFWCVFAFLQKFSAILLDPQGGADVQLKPSRQWEALSCRRLTKPTVGKREEKKKSKLIGLYVTDISPYQFSVNASGSRYFSIKSTTTRFTASFSTWWALSLNKQVSARRHTLSL